jgi:2-amino-4-hydroxy-6-hydroxymethyldihydropteridine diphosphokinase
LRARGKILVGLGANRPGPWGAPAATIKRALGEMEKTGIVVEAISPLYETAAIGRARQPAYINAVVLIDSNLSPEALLRRLKSIERRAGRRGGRPWGPRSLDIDIIDHKGLVRHWRARQAEFPRAGTRPLVLPHPLMHERPFVLKPLLDIAPDWRHPVLGRSIGALWRDAATKRQGQVLKPLQAASACQA